MNRERIGQLANKGIENFINFSNLRKYCLILAVVSAGLFTAAGVFRGVDGATAVPLAMAALSGVIAAKV